MKKLLEIKKNETIFFPIQIHRLKLCFVYAGNQQTVNVKWKNNDDDDNNQQLTYDNTR